MKVERNLKRIKMDQIIYPEMNITYRKFEEIILQKNINFLVFLV